MREERLPASLTAFIGRENELTLIGQLLGDPACRLLTLTGPGGIGKTQLALMAAARKRDAFSDGVCFVALQPVSSIDFLVPTIADALGCSLGGPRSTEQLVHFLQPREMLLVLDNFEHLLEGVNLLSDMLLAVPRIKLLVTSREVLNLRSEWVYPVEGLCFPPLDHRGSIEHFDAVHLFVERARHIRRDFVLSNEYDHVAQICRLLDGNPLGIELAASWLTTLSSAELAAEIQHGLDLFTTSLRDIPERHQSIRAVFGQSWKRLSADEQRVMAKLTVFQGGFRRDAAVAVAGADLPTLSSLVAHSLLRLREAGRYDVHELLRQYGEEKLREDPEQEQAVHDLHCAYYAQFLSQTELRLKGKGYLEALDTIQEEIDNVRAA